MSDGAVVAFLRYLHVAPTYVVGTLPTLPTVRPGEDPVFFSAFSTLPYLTYLSWPAYPLALSLLVFCIFVVIAGDSVRHTSSLSYLPTSGRCVRLSTWVLVAWRS